MKIYHNPRCRKSRETLALLESKGVTPEQVLYLQTPPTAKELKDIVAMLDIAPAALVRKSEPIYKEMYKGKSLSDDEWIEAMIQHPKLIERPIVIKGNQAIIGRPPENVLTLLT